MRLKINAYAAEEQISRQAAIKRINRIGEPIAADGTVDGNAVRQKWNRYADSTRGGKPDRKATAAASAGQGEVPEGKTRAEAQRFREWLRLEREKLQWKKELGELIDAAETGRAIEARFRADSEAILNWPARVVAEMAAEVDVDDRVLSAALEKYIRRFMSERASVDQ